MDVSTRQMDFEARHIAEFHTDIHGIRNHRDVGAMPQVPCDPSSGGTSRKPYRLVLLNQFCGRDTNVTLFPHELLFAGLKRCVVTEGFIEEFLHQRGSPVGTPHQPFAFEPSQVASNTRRRSTQRGNQLLHAYAAPLQQQFQDSLGAMFESFGHVILQGLQDSGVVNRPLHSVLNSFSIYEQVYFYHQFSANSPPEISLDISGCIASRSINMSDHSYQIQYM